MLLLKQRIATKQGFRTVVEYRIIKPDGSIRWVLDRAFPLKCANGRARRIVGIAEDITEQKCIEAELRRTKELADVANQAKSSFLASMSHEIRTPLTAIKGFAELAMAPEMNNEIKNNYISVIRRNANQLGILIDDILDISKVEAGKTIGCSGKYIIAQFTERGHDKLIASGGRKRHRTLLRI
jgi:signal transduction histidine kinase